MFKVERRSLRIVLRLLSAGIIILALTSCSAASNESAKDNDTGLIVRNKKPEKISVDGLLSLPKSEAGATEFAFYAANVFASTDIVQKSVFEKVLSSDSDFSISGAILRNQSETDPKITFSPIGIAIDRYANGKASVAVVGLSFESGNETIASWKEIHMDLVYKDSWGVSDFGIGVINGPTTNGQALDPEFLASWSGYIFPQNELSSGQRPIIAQ